MEKRLIARVLVTIVVCGITVLAWTRLDLARQEFPELARTGGQVELADYLLENAETDADEDELKIRSMQALDEYKAAHFRVGGLIFAAKLTTIANLIIFIGSIWWHRTKKQNKPA